MRLETATVADWAVLNASGELDLAGLPELRDALAALVGAGGCAVVLDLSGVSLLDCSCIRVLVEARQRAQRSGGDMRVVGARNRVRRVLQITGAASELGVCTPERARGESGDLPSATVEALLVARAALAGDDPRRALLREQAVEFCLPVATSIARQFRHTAQRRDDLCQVAALGLLKALDRYDPARGARFLSFAYPTILGELRRHFRDHTWGVHVPRHLQEVGYSVTRAAEVLTQRLHRAPTPGELAEELDVPVEEVHEALVAAQGYVPASLSQPVGDADAIELGDRIGGVDGGIERVEYHQSLLRLLAELPDQERQVLAYRFFGNLTQTQLAGILGVSQMQVSRVQSRALRRLRAGLLVEG